MPLVIVIQWTQHCNNSKSKKPKSQTTSPKQKKTGKTKANGTKHTDKRNEDKNNVESQSGPGGDKEVSDRMYSNYDGGDGDCEKQLYRHDRVYLPNKRPPELWILQHHRI